MSAYVIAEVEIQDPEQFERYREMVPETLARFGGRYIARGGETRMLEGEPPPSRLVVIEFDDLDQAVAWHDSDIYREARTLRQKSARSRLVAVDGL